MTVFGYFHKKGSTMDVWLCLLRSFLAIGLLYILKLSIVLRHQVGLVLIEPHILWKITFGLGLHYQIWLKIFCKINVYRKRPVAGIRYLFGNLVFYLVILIFSPKIEVKLSIHLVRLQFFQKN